MLDTLKKRGLYAVLAVLLCVVSVFAIIQYKRASELKYAQEIEYNRVFSELTQYVDDLEISLLKGQIVSTPQQIAKLSSDLYRQSSGAKANLALLPLEEVQLEKTSEFLSQVGEFANTVSLKLQRGGSITPEETKTVQSLTQYAGELKQGLDKMLDGINNGEITFSGKSKRLSSIMNKSTAMAKGMESLEEEFHNYPSLIYDGPFSQHLSIKESVFTQGKLQITPSQALEAAKKYTGKSKCSVEEIGGRLPAYSIECGEKTVEYTRGGGYLLLYMNDKMPEDEKISIKSAKEKAMQFLSENGFSDMKASYYDKREGSVIINYAYTQGGYTVYPDLVKVKVSLDDGEIIGFESRGYMMNHCYRDIPTPVISKEEATGKINQNLNVQSVTMALIPLDGGSEAPCYQIKGVVSDKHFLVYVNTQTGFIEDMQILLENENGTLAV